MLGKLLKYDLKDAAKVMPVAYAALVFVTAAAGVFKLVDIIAFRLMLSLIVIVASCALFVAALAYIVIRYYRNVFGAEGYLTRTLPVSHGSIMASKLLSGLIVYFVTLAMAFGGIYAAYYFITGTLMPINFNELFSGRMAPIVIFVLISTLAQSFLLITEIYFAMTLAHHRLFLKNNIVFSVVFCFAIGSIVSVLESLAAMFLPLSIMIGPEGSRLGFTSMLSALDFNVISEQTAAAMNISIPDFPIGMGGFFVDICAIVVLIALTNWLMKKKTSIK